MNSLSISEESVTRVEFYPETNDIAISKAKLLYENKFSKHIEEYERL